MLASSRLERAPPCCFLCLCTPLILPQVESDQPGLPLAPFGCLLFVGFFGAALASPPRDIFFLAALDLVLLQGLPAI